jgi:hypothetical protein
LAYVSTALREEQEPFGTHLRSGQAGQACQGQLDAVRAAAASIVLRKGYVPGQAAAPADAASIAAACDTPGNASMPSASLAAAVLMATEAALAVRRGQAVGDTGVTAALLAARSAADRSKPLVMPNSVTAGGVFRPLPKVILRVVLPFCGSVAVLIVDWRWQALNLSISQNGQKNNVM